MPPSFAARFTQSERAVMKIVADSQVGGYATCRSKRLLLDRLQSHQCAERGDLLDSDAEGSSAAVPVEKENFEDRCVLSDVAAVAGVIDVADNAFLNITSKLLIVFVVR
jgi:hypothetical protein